MMGSEIEADYGTLSHTSTSHSKNGLLVQATTLGQTRGFRVFRQKRGDFLVDGTVIPAKYQNENDRYNLVFTMALDPKDAVDAEHGFRRALWGSKHWRHRHADRRRSNGRYPQPPL